MPPERSERGKDAFDMLVSPALKRSFEQAFIDISNPANPRGLEYEASLFVGAHEIDQTQFARIGNALLGVVEVSARVVRSIRSAGDATMAEDTLVYVRERIKAALEDLTDDQLRVPVTGSADQLVPMGQLNLHRYAEARMLLEERILAGADLTDDDVQKLFFSVAYGDAAQFANVLRDDVDNLQAAYLEFMVNPPAEVPLIAAGVNLVDPIKSLFRRVNDPNLVNQNADWLGGDYLTNIRRRVYGFHDSPAEKLDPITTQQLKDLALVLSWITTVARNNPDIYNQYGVQVLGQAIGGGRTAAEGIRDIVEDTLQRNEAASLMDQDPHYIGWRNSLRFNTRVDGSSMVAYLANVRHELAQPNPNLDGENVENLEHLIEQLELTRGNIDGIRYANPEFDQQIRAAKQLYIDDQVREIRALIQQIEAAVPSRSRIVSQSSELIGRPATETDKAWFDLLKQRLEEAKAQPAIYDAVLEEIRVQIMERLNLIYESWKQEWSGRPQYYGYSMLVDWIDPSSDPVHQDKLIEIKRRSEEMGMVRTIADMAQEGGVSKAMSSEWSVAGKQEGSNGLSVLHYDYFTQWWGTSNPNDENGTPLDKSRKTECHAYKHAEAINYAIKQYYKWLRFGDGRAWQDGELWKKNASEFVTKSLIESSKDIYGLTFTEDSPEIQEMERLVYNITYGLGIRQHAFLDKFAVGGTPNGRLGDLFHWVDSVQILPTFWYKTYKDPEYNPSEEVFMVPDKWMEKCLSVGVPPKTSSEKPFVDDDRMSNISKSRELTKRVLAIFAPRRKPTPIGRREHGFEGDELSPAYETLFGAVILRAEQRREQRGGGFDFTFVEFLNGHAAFKDFKEHLMGVPGNMWGSFEQTTPPEEIIKKIVDTVNGKEVDEVITILLASYKTLVTKHFSYLKKCWFAVDANQVAYGILGYIDKMFRILALHNKVTPGHYTKLLDEVRKLTKGAANMTNLGKRRSSDPIDPNNRTKRVPPIYGSSDDDLAWSEDEFISATGEKKLTKREKSGYDIRDFILNRLPTTVEDDEGHNLIGLALRPVAKFTHQPITMIGNIEDRRRVAPTQFTSKVTEMWNRFQLWKMLREYNVTESFKRSTYFAFGMPAAEQQKNPDSK